MLQSRNVLAGALGVGEGQVVRREDFLDAAGIAALTERTSSFDPETILVLAREVFGEIGEVETALLMLGPGEGISALSREGTRGGFVLDLDPPQWRSEWGGLLLFQSGERLHGYRPVPGALTLFAADARPMISLVMLRAPPRVSLLGQWA